MKGILFAAILLSSLCVLFCAGPALCQMPPGQGEGSQISVKGRPWETDERTIVPVEKLRGGGGIVLKSPGLSREFRPLLREEKHGMPSRSQYAPLGPRQSWFRFELIFFHTFFN